MPQLRLYKMDGANGGSGQSVRIELTDEQLERIVERVYEKLYIQIGKNVVRQGLLLFGAVVLAASAYLGFWHK